MGEGKKHQRYLDMVGEDGQKEGKAPQDIEQVFSKTKDKGCGYPLFFTPIK
jgi:hypothetical protein